MVVNIPDTFACADNGVKTDFGISCDRRNGVTSTDLPRTRCLPLRTRARFISPHYHCHAACRTTPFCHATLRCHTFCLCPYATAHRATRCPRTAVVVHTCPVQLPYLRAALLRTRTTCLTAPSCRTYTGAIARSLLRAIATTHARDLCVLHGGAISVIVARIITRRKSGVLAPRHAPGMTAW